MDQKRQVLVNRSVENRWQAIVDVIDETVDSFEGQVIVKTSIESCSGAVHLAEELIEQADWSVTLVHPGIVNRMKQNPDKSDKADAFVLADLMRLGDLPRVWLAPEEIRQLRSLVRFRARKVKHRTQVTLSNLSASAPNAAAGHPSQASDQVAGGSQCLDKGVAAATVLPNAAGPTARWLPPLVTTDD